MRRLAATARGALSLSIYALNTFFWCGLLFILTGLKALFPMEGWRTRFTSLSHGVAENWIGVNNLNQRLLGRTRYKVEGLGRLNRSGWYLVLANHQCWVDILVLQRLFNRKIPFLKFFIKEKLFWFPVLGQAWWALDFPHVRRYSKNALEKNPRLKDKNLENTRKNCERVKRLPTSIMNFPEGTRFSRAKQRRQGSPFRHLLNPKAGGMAQVLQLMGDWLDGVLDVSIVYPDRAPSFWNFICGQTREVRVSVRCLAVGPELAGDYSGDAGFRERFQLWLNDTWREKDAILEALGQGLGPKDA